MDAAAATETTKAGLGQGQGRRGAGPSAGGGVRILSSREPVLRDLCGTRGEHAHGEKGAVGRRACEPSGGEEQARAILL